MRASCPGFLHVAIGQEAVAVGVCQAMEEGDVFASTHRAHGHTLARGTHPNAVMAELYGKIEGCSHGYGGSMHLYDVERGNYRRERRHRRRPAGRHRRRPRVQAARRAARRGRLLRRRRDEHRHLPRVAQPRAALEDEDGVRLREQPLGRVDAGLAALAGVGRHVEARARVRHARDQGRRPGRRRRSTTRRTRRSSSRAPAKGRSSSTSRPTACTATSSATRRSTARRKTARRRPTTIRSCGCASASVSATTSSSRSTREAHEIVDAALEFAQNGTDPQPEDALKNVYA